MTSLESSLLRDRLAMRGRMLRRGLALAFIFLVPALAMAVPAASPFAGHWEGSIEVPGMKLGIDVDLVQKEDGSWGGNISIPVQEAKDVPLANIRVDGSSITFDLPGPPGNPSFQGRLSDDGKTISGDFTQGGQTLPFHLEARPAGAPPAPPNGGEKAATGEMKNPEGEGKAAPGEGKGAPGKAGPGEGKGAPEEGKAAPQEGKAPGGAAPGETKNAPAEGHAAPAESQGSLAGHWEGSIDIPGSPLAIDIDFSRGEGGGWKGDISIPAQGAKDMPLANVTLEGQDISFDLPGPQGNPSFKGKLAADGRSISGDFTQGGGAFPFHLASKPSPAATARQALEGFDEFVAKAMNDWKVPGLALVVVKDGEVVLSKGYGFRDVERKLPVTPGTLFAIGSSTKAFTTFLMGTLVDEGRLDWDTPVVHYIPTFRLSDKVSTERITPRDLVTHRSGLPRHDLVWYNSTLSRKDLVERLPYLEPNRDFRAEFHYQNLMFLTAGYLTETITGQSWEDSVRERIFDPLGMTRSNFSIEESRKSADYAIPYEEKDDVVKEMHFRNITNMGPAGSINSNLEDMTRWLLVQLGRGKIDGKQVIGETTLADMHTPQMAINTPAERPEIPETSYGLGWFVEPYRGHNRIHHGGNIDGFSAMVTFLPQDQIGLVILTNMNGTPATELLARHAIDRLLKLDPINWSSEALAKKAIGTQLQKEGEKKKEILRRPGTRPAHDLAEYAGDYGNPGYGDLKVELKDGRLELTYNDIRTPLEHWHYDVFNASKGAKDPVLADMKFLFLTSMKGEVDAVQAPFEPEVADIVFRKPDARLSDPVYLKQFLGDYELGPQVVKVAMRGSRLVLSTAGQPTFELLPGRENEFTLKEYSVISVKFIVDPKEGVTEASFNQPNGVFSAKRKKA